VTHYPITFCDSPVQWARTLSEDEITVPKVEDFYSVNEVNKPPEDRVYHNNSACHSGRDIPSMIEYLAHRSATGSATIAST
jgi:hypothetical protein